MKCVLTFLHKEEFLHAIAILEKNGVKDFKAFLPYELKELQEQKNPLSWITLSFGLFGAAAGFFMQAYANIWSYPLDIGGKPFFSWPAFLPITFVCGILSAAIATFIAFFVYSKLPEPYHAVFNASKFRLSEDYFYLLLPNKQLALGLTPFSIEEIAE